MMQQADAVFEKNLAELTELLPRLGALAPAVGRLAEAMKACFDSGCKMLVAGNGGSAADAMHFAEELVVRFAKNRQALPAIALCDPTVITCAGNDFGYDTVFTRQVEALGKPGDLLVVMSTSGNSANLVLAVQQAAKAGVKTCSLTGKDGGKLDGLCDLQIVVPSQITHHIQEAHKLIYHALCEWIDTQY